MNSLQHIAIIMDGNGRWAERKKKPRLYGHIKGARVAKKIIIEAADQNLKFLTLYTFSAENWNRPIIEVNFLMRLLERYLIKETDNLVKKNIQFSVIGEINKLPSSVQKLIQYTIEKTAKSTGLKVCFAISYSSRNEITEAVRLISNKIVNCEIKLEDVNSEIVSQFLMTSTRQDPDLIIRTSGEYRLSNFLLWQSAYSEFYFSQTLWPDFNTIEFNSICMDYSRRDRRYGKVLNQEPEAPLKHLENNDRA